MVIKENMEINTSFEFLIARKYPVSKKYDKQKEIVGEYFFIHILLNLTLQAINLKRLNVSDYIFRRNASFSQENEFLGECVSVGKSNWII